MAADAPYRFYAEILSADLPGWNKLVSEENIYASASIFNRDYWRVLELDTGYREHELSVDKLRQIRDGEAVLSGPMLRAVFDALKASDNTIRVVTQKLGQATMEHSTDAGRVPTQKGSTTIEQSDRFNRADLLAQKRKLYERETGSTSDATFPDIESEKPDYSRAAQKVHDAAKGKWPKTKGCEVTLFPDQELSVEAFAQALDQGEQDSRLVAPPRSGKTYMFGVGLLALMAEQQGDSVSFSDYSLYTAPTVRIAKQTRDTLINEFHIPEECIGYIDGKTTDRAAIEALEKPVQIIVQASAINIFRTDKSGERFEKNPRKITDYKFFVPDELHGFTADAGAGLYQAFKKAGAITLGLTGSDTLMLIRDGYRRVVDKITIGDILQDGKAPIREISPSESTEAGSMAPTIEYIIQANAGVAKRSHQLAKLTDEQENEIHRDVAATVIEAFRDFDDPRLPYKPSEKGSIWFVPPGLEGDPRGKNGKDLVQRLNKQFGYGYADCIYAGKNEDGSPKTGPLADENDNVINRFKAGEIKAIVNVGMLHEGITLKDAYSVWETCPTNSPRKKVQAGFRASTICDNDPNKIATCFTLKIPGIHSTSLTEIYGPEVMQRIEDIASRHFVEPEPEPELPEPSRVENGGNRPSGGRGGRREPRHSFGGNSNDSRFGSASKYESPLPPYEILSGASTLHTLFNEQLRIDIPELLPDKPDHFLTRTEYAEHLRQGNKHGVPVSATDNIFQKTAAFIALQKQLEENVSRDYDEIDEDNAISNTFVILGATVTSKNAGYFMVGMPPRPQFCISQSIADIHKDFYSQTAVIEAARLENGLGAADMARAQNINEELAGSFYRTLRRKYETKDGDVGEDIYIDGSRIPRSAVGINLANRRLLVDAAYGGEVKKWVTLPPKTDKRWGVADINKNLGTDRAGPLLASLEIVFKNSPGAETITYNGVDIPASAFGYCRTAPRTTFTIEAETYSDALNQMLGKYPPLTSANMIRTDGRNKYNRPQTHFPRCFDVIEPIFNIYQVFQKESIDPDAVARVDVKAFITDFKQREIASSGISEEALSSGKIDAFGESTEAETLRSINKRADALEKGLKNHAALKEHDVKIDVEGGKIMILGVPFDATKMGYFSRHNGVETFALSERAHLTPLNRFIDKKMVQRNGREKEDFTRLRQAVSGLSYV